MGLSQELANIGMSKKELADLLKVSRMTIQRMGEDIPPDVQKILDASKEPPYEWVDKPVSMFDGKGRGVPVDGYVLISRGWITLEGEDKVSHGVVTEEAWKARLSYTCKHGMEGWSCKRCLREA